MRLKKLTTILIASVISAVVLAICLHKVVYQSNHYEISITIKYEEDVYEEYKLMAGDALLLLKEPIRDGYEFLGWYSDAEYTKEFNFNSAIKRNTTIYAKMQKI